MPARFRRIIDQQAQVSSIETFYSNSESLTIVLLSKYIEYQPSSPWYSPNCCWKLLSLSDLVTTELPQSRSCRMLPVAYQFSHRFQKCPARVLKRSDLIDSITPSTIHKNCETKCMFPLPPDQLHKSCGRVMIACKQH